MFLSACLIVAATLAAFSNSFGGPFVFDDRSAIVENPTIRRLWPPSTPLGPPSNGATVTGRPLLNLSLAINYAMGGLDVWGFHAANLAIHLAAALLLFGILRRTLLLPAMRDRFGAAATPLGLAVAALWALHPLQTESVTYLAQRAESLVGFFYLLALYGLIRGAGEGIGEWGFGIGPRGKQPGNSNPLSLIPHPLNPPNPLTPWYAVSFLACLLGMASKEVMVSAPVILLIFDRTFLSGSFRAAWRQRRGLYLALAGTWLLLAWLVFSAGNRGGSAGFGTEIGPGNTSARKPARLFTTCACA